MPCWGMRPVDCASVPGEAIESFGSTRFTALAHASNARVTLCRLEAGGLIGRHRAPIDQLFVVISGSGIVSAGSTTLEVAGGQAVLFHAGEDHGTRSPHGLCAVVVECPGLAEQL